ncbi:Helix-turn-helix [Actinopolyspora mzabensis]|uniref:Helix-turn-helix n=1 Tax=Actinopolyspora mzabensis TaxID=995066 RepID=A0A1G8WY02_ACTMZ|nr:helix-turn-helix transcriptional regulator [Actinopolyspora mzabensis]SDJ82495.1 Helix-turn-helix [Actinopolyspora mzabensis]
MDHPVKAVNRAVNDLGGYIRAQRATAQISLRQLAKRAGVSNPYLSQVERGLRKPSAEILQQIANALRISAEALYVQAGFLESRPGGPVVDAILADTELSDRQKQVLLDVYTSFRGENGENGASEAVLGRDRESRTEPESREETAVHETVRSESEE